MNEILTEEEVKKIPFFTQLKMCYRFYLIVFEEKVTFEEYVISCIEESENCDMTITEYINMITCDYVNDTMFC